MCCGSPDTQKVNLYPATNQVKQQVFRLLHDFKMYASVRNLIIKIEEAETTRMQVNSYMQNDNALTFKAYRIYITGVSGFQKLLRIEWLCKIYGITVKTAGFFQFQIPFWLVALDTEKSPSPKFNILQKKKFRKKYVFLKIKTHLFSIFV